MIRRLTHTFFEVSLLLFFIACRFVVASQNRLLTRIPLDRLNQYRESFIESNAAANLLEIVNVQSSNLRGDKKNNKRHFFERLSVTLQRENGSMLLERSPLPAADVDGVI